MKDESILSRRKQRSLEKKFAKLDRQKAREEQKARRRGGSLPGHRNWAPLERPSTGSRIPQRTFNVMFLSVLFLLCFWYTMSVT